MRRVKIIGTIGPASASEERLEALLRAGLDVARLNCSHGTTQERIEVVRRVRAASKRLGKPVCVFLDLRGPRLRMGELPPEGKLLQPGDEIRLVTDGAAGAAEADALPVQSPFLAAGVAAGQPIFINDGLIELSVLETDGVTLRCRVERGGRITSHKGINAPGANLAVPILEEEDLQDIRTMIREGIDAIAVSFVRNANDMLQVRTAARAFDPGIPMIAKLETSQAMEHLEGILEVSDAIMIARGDLGVERPPEDVPILQKRLISHANRRGRPVITATQMLESMVEHERPTRAEASDVANAVFDGTDCVMLSAETSVGKHPVRTVQIMDRILRAAEEEWLLKRERRLLEGVSVDSILAVSEAACRAADGLGARKIVTFTRTGRTAASVSQCRPKCPIIAFSPHEPVLRRLNLLWGVVPRPMPLMETTDDLIAAMDRQLLEQGLAETGDTVILVAGIPLASQTPTNFIKVHKVGKG
jgi:pyruvate kinase